jgi:TrmH family RNA methyltransferase
MESVEIRLQKFIEKNKYDIEAIGVQNGKIKEVIAIINNSKPNKNNYFVIDGIWAHEKALNNNIEVDSFIFCPEIITSHEAMNLIESFFAKAKKTYQVSLKTFMKICEKDDPKGMISICKFPLSTLDDIKLNKNNIIIVLDGLEIPGNVGTILRASDGANIDAVFLCNRRARITHPKIIKGSMGAAFTIPVVEFPTVEECKEWLKKKNFDLYLADTRAEKHYFEYDYSGRVAIIMGSERYGITKPWYEGDYNMLSIPMLGQCDSLNVAIATTIVAYEASMKQNGFIKKR